MYRERERPNLVFSISTTAETSKCQLFLVYFPNIWKFCTHSLIEYSHRHTCKVQKEHTHTFIYIDIPSPRYCSNISVMFHLNSPSEKEKNIRHFIILNYTEEYSQQLLHNFITT